MKARIATWALGICLAATPAIFASAEKQPEPDNSKMNQNAGVTADDQGMSTSDTELIGKIRSAVMKDKSLSTYAHNVKIVAKSGQVTLRGPVRSDEEKSRIEKIATEIAGASSVTNELTIAPSK